jgi:hypothetical protein
VAGAAAIGADGWPVGPGIVSFNANIDTLDPTAKSYTLVMIEGTATALDVNQGAGNGGHVGGQWSGQVATFTAKGIVGGSLPIAITLTSAGRSRWALVRTDELDAWKANPKAQSPSWMERFKPPSRFKTARFMDWLMTNSNMGPGYVDTDPSRPGAFVRGVPLDVMVAFAKQTGIQPWFCIPAASTDDEIRSFAKRIDECRTAGLKPIIEFGNELWNAQFAAHGYAIAQEKALWGDAEQAAYQQALAVWNATPLASRPKSAPAKPALSEGHRWYGYRATQVSKILQSLGWRVGVDFEMAIGCFPNGWDRAPLVWGGVAKAGGGDADFSMWIITFYLHGALGGDFNKTVAIVKAQDFDGAINETLHGTVSSVDWFASVYLPAHVAIAKAHNLKLAAYEGNWLSFYTIPFFADSALLKAKAGITQADVVGFFAKLAVHPRGGEVMTAVLTAMEKAGVVLACANYDQGLGGENGFWGLYGTPAWGAMVAWMVAHPSPDAVKAGDLPSIRTAIADALARLDAVIAG